MPGKHVSETSTKIDSNSTDSSNTDACGGDQVTAEETPGQPTLPVASSKDDQNAQALASISTGCVFSATIIVLAHKIWSQTCWFNFWLRTIVLLLQTQTNLSKRSIAFAGPSLALPVPRFCWPIASGRFRRLNFVVPPLLSASHFCRHFLSIGTPSTLLAHTSLCQSLAFVGPSLLVASDV